MDYSIDSNANGFTLVIRGRFTFDDNGDFREVLTRFEEPQLSSVLLDLKALEFVDSAALGMFLLAREAAEKHSVALSLTMPEHPQPAKMLQVSKFDDIFTIV